MAGLALGVVLSLPLMRTGQFGLAAWLAEVGLTGMLMAALNIVCNANMSRGAPCD